jgi:hypothetical protein
VPEADSARRSQLLSLKLGALIREHLGGLDGWSPVPFAGGAAFRNGGHAWVLVEDRPERGLGPALAWCRHHHIAELDLVADHGTGVLARRARWFARAPRVWRVEGRRIVEAAPEPFPAAIALDPELAAFAPLIRAGGAVPVEEHGVLVGEVEGLEVCRAVRDPATGQCRLEVGVGVHDREAFVLIHGNVPAPEALATVVAAVAPHRQPGADPHALNRLGAERRLRARLIAEPAPVGAAHLAPAPPPVPRANLKDAVPCVALGRTPSGEDVVVVCSTGIDVDLVPFAADARAALGLEGARLVLAVRERDASPVTMALADALATPAAVCVLDTE